MTLWIAPLDNLYFRPDDILIDQDMIIPPQQEQTAMAELYLYIN